MPPLVLDGSAGVSGVDGTASNPSYEGTDSNTGIFFPAADTVAIGTGGTEALRVNSSQNVGFGTQSPAAKADIVGASGITSFTGTSFLGLQLRGATSTNDYSGIGFSGTSQGAPTAKIAAYFTGSGSYLQFGTSNNYVGGITNTAMTIDFSANVGIGTTSPSTRLEVSSSGIPALINSSNNQYVLQLSYLSNTSKAYLGTFNNALIFAPSSGSEAARITSGGIFTMQSSTANGVYIQSGSEVTLASNATITITSATAGACVILVYEIGGGEGGMFWANFSAVVTKVAGDGSATDAGSNIAVYKSAASHTTTIKNRYATTRTFRIAVYSAQANP